VGTSTPILVPELKSLKLDPSRVERGQSIKVVNATVVLTSPGLSDGARIELVSDNSLATVPSIVIIQPGAYSGDFNIKIQPYRRSDNSQTETTVTLTAKYQGVSKDAKLIVVPPPPKLTSLVLNPPVSGVNEYVNGTITLSGPVPSSDVKVNLRSSKRSMAPVPSEVIVKGGRTANFSFKIPSTSPAGDVTITASDDRGVSLSQTLTVVHPQ
jgi:hypothetical protein